MAIDAELLFPMLDAVDNTNAKGEFYLTVIVGIARTEGHRCAVVTCEPVEPMGVDSRMGLAAAEAAMQARLRTAAMGGGTTQVAPAHVFWGSWRAPVLPTVTNPQLV